MKESLRPGGRSARIQASVHQAVRELLATVDRSALTLPLIAARAGVTPSTLYRRWGDLAGLLADVAVDRLRPDGEPPDTGSLRADLEAWLEQYIDELTSVPGRAMIRDVLACPGDSHSAGQCAAFVRQQLQVISDRARNRGEAPLDLDLALDHVIAPVMYRILYHQLPPDPTYWRGLIDRLLQGGTAASPVEGHGP